MSEVLSRFFEAKEDERIVIGTVRTGSVNADFTALICAALEWAEANGVTARARSNLMRSFEREVNNDRPIE